MKYVRHWRTALLAFLFTTLVYQVFAQGGALTNSLPVIPFAISGLAQPQGSWVLLLALGVPMLVALIKNEVPKLPSWSLPLLAPALGALADYLIHKWGGQSVGPVWGAVLGAAGVGLREIKDQVQQRIADASAPGVPAPPPPQEPPKAS